MGTELGKCDVVIREIKKGDGGEEEGKERRKNGRA